MVYHHKATTTTGGGGPSFICICKCKNLKSTAWLQYYCELVTFLLAMLHTAWRPMTIRVGSLGMLNGMYSMYMSSCLDFCAPCLFELVTSVFENSCTAMHVNFQHDLTCQVITVNWQPKDSQGDFSKLLSNLQVWQLMTSLDSHDSVDFEERDDRTRMLCTAFSL